MEIQEFVNRATYVKAKAVNTEEKNHKKLGYYLKGLCVPPPVRGPRLEITALGLLTVLTQTGLQLLGDCDFA